MNYEISKELFEAVMDFKVDNVSITTVYANIDVGLRYERKETLYTIVDCVGIDTFFFKCKEWALRQGGLTILSGTYKNTVKGFLQNKAYIGYAAIQYYVIDEYRTGTYCLKTHDRIKASCERQAVFDICQRILNNKEK